MKEPETDEEWQQAVDGAAGLRAIADCKMYGLLEGGPEIDVARCDDLLERGRQRGVFPAKPVDELVVGLIAAIDEEARTRLRRSEGQQRRRARERAEKESATFSEPTARE